MGFLWFAPYFIPPLICPLYPPFVFFKKDLSNGKRAFPCRHSCSHLFLEGPSQPERGFYFGTPFNPKKIPPHQLLRPKKGFPKEHWKKDFPIRGGPIRHKFGEMGKNPKVKVHNIGPKK